ncbi:methyltransferase [Candidimonas nitroreducens]|uniref:Methyltransferase n=1 Tax=Candidimonas nitroreducens TaxID=683354 RepID=A0A225MF56_9BURK|nr:class I SAM-dependent methyltransferase [Candidimonas nitroreducens]OWT57599.1 methyltransferase [Candidimonas nitroreducens]
MNTAAAPSDTHHASWIENGQARRALWRAPGGGTAPRRIEVVDDTLNADAAFRLANAGACMLWRGDFHNAVQLLQALARRVDARRGRKRHGAEPVAQAEAFNLYRMAQSQRARLLNSVLIELDAGFGIGLRRAPDVRQACTEALAAAGEPMLLPLRALQGIVGAHEWRRKGVAVEGLEHPIHVHYGVFSPLRGEYLDLLRQAPLPATDLAFDIGTGSGVIAALLAARGVRRIVATDLDPRALACARENFQRQGLTGRIELQDTDLFPEGLSPLIVCNPPWLPARPTLPQEQAIYDPDSRMLLGFLDGLRGHLRAGGEGWLILSDLAEHLGLRAPGFLAGAIAAAGLQVLGRLDIRPRHRKAADPDDPLYAARRAEVTSLWRLVPLQ